jgi:hypothetical protein
MKSLYDTLLVTSDQLVAEAATCTTQTQETNIMPSTGYEPAITAIKRLRLQTYALGVAATGIC